MRGLMAYQRGQTPAARAFYQESYNISERIGDTEQMVRPLGNLGGLAVLEGDHERKAVALQRAESDLDHHLGAVPASGDEVHLRAHRPLPRVAAVGVSVGRVSGPDRVGHECIDRHGDELFGRVAEQLRRRRVGHHDPAGGVGDDQRIGIGREEGAKDRAFVDARRHAGQGTGLGHPGVTGGTRM